MNRQRKMHSSPFTLPNTAFSVSCSSGGQGSHKQLRQALLLDTCCTTEVGSARQGRCIQ